MRPGSLGWDDLPADVQRELGMSKAKTSSRVTAWKDVPSSWTQHRGCGWAGTGDCIYCPERDEGNSVQGDAPEHAV